MRQYLAEYSLKEANFVIRPDLTHNSSWRKFLLGHLDLEAINIGIKETEKIIPKLKKALSL